MSLGPESSHPFFARYGVMRCHFMSGARSEVKAPAIEVVDPTTTSLGGMVIHRPLWQSMALCLIEKDQEFDLPQLVFDDERVAGKAEIQILRAGRYKLRW